MKVPFTLESWLKDKSQKIETVNGHSVRIVSTDVKSAERPDRILALVMGDGGCENAIYYNTDGYCLSDSTISSTHRKKDLVIVYPEPEFTPFEAAFDSALRDYCCDDEKVNSYQEWIKKKAEPLMKIAKKELFTKGVGLYFFNDGHTYFCGTPGMEAKEEPPVTAATVKEDEPITYVNDNDDWLHQPQVKYDLHKYCPKCGREMTCDKNVIYTSYPPKLKYTCPNCGNVEYLDVMLNVLIYKEDSAYCGEGQTVTDKRFAAGQVLGKSTNEICTKAD